MAEENFDEQELSTIPGNSNPPEVQWPENDTKDPTDIQWPENDSNDPPEIQLPENDSKDPPEIQWPENDAKDPPEIQGPENDTKNDGLVNDEAKKWPGWPGENVFRMLVPGHKVGGIIGRKGEYIKKTCEETKARIKFLDGHPGTTERTVCFF